MVRSRMARVARIARMAQESASMDSGGILSQEELVESHPAPAIHDEGSDTFQPPVPHILWRFLQSLQIRFSLYLLLRLFFIHGAMIFGTLLLGTLLRLPRLVVLLTELGLRRQ